MIPVWKPDFPFAPRKLPFFYGWVIVAGATIGILFSIPGQTMGFSVFTEVLMEKLQLSRFQLSAAYCVGTVASGFTLPYLGRLFDQVGARKMVFWSAFSTGVVLFYLSGSFWLNRTLAGFFPASLHTAVALVVIGIGFYMIRASAQGVLTMTCRNAVGKWFNQRRGLALAISGVVTSFGFSAAPKLLDLMIEQFGHSGAWAVLGICSILIMSVLGWLVIRDNPEECGLVMDGRPAKESRNRNPDMIIHHEFTRNEALGTVTFWVFNLSFAFYAMYFTAFAFHIVSIGKEFGHSKDFIITLFVPSAALSVVTSLIIGAINPYFRLKHLLAVMNLGALGCTIGLYNLDTSWGVITYVAGSGVCGGGFASLTGIVWPRFFGRKWLGSISGVSMSSMVIGSGLGPPIFGACEQWTGSYSLLLLISIAAPVILVTASFFADNPQRKLI